jgi:hypothetical protein
MARTSGFSDLLYPDLENVFVNRYKRYTRQWSTIFPVEVMDRTPYEDFEMTGLGGGLRKLREGQGVTYDDMFAGQRKMYEAEKYGRGHIITEEMIDDDLYGIMARSPQELAFSAQIFMEYLAARMLDDAFDGVDPRNRGFDRQPLCSNKHQFIAKEAGPMGPIQSNIIGGGAHIELGQASFLAACIQMERFTDFRGRPILMQPSLLVYSNELAPLAKQVLDSEYQPFSSENTVNPAATQAPGMKRFKYLFKQDRRSWFVIAEKSNFDAKLAVRKRVTFDMADDFSTGNALTKCITRVSYGHGQWMGIVGSKGAP